MDKKQKQNLKGKFTKLLKKINKRKKEKKESKRKKDNDKYDYEFKFKPPNERKLELKDEFKNKGRGIE